jgi:hypothetical protein
MFDFPYRYRSLISVPITETRAAATITVAEIINNHNIHNKAINPIGGILINSICRAFLVEIHHIMSILRNRAWVEEDQNRWNRAEAKRNRAEAVLFFSYHLVQYNCHQVPNKRPRVSDTIRPMLIDT